MENALWVAILAFAAFGCTDQPSTTDDLRSASDLGDRDGAQPSSGRHCGATPTTLVTLSDLPGFIAGGSLAVPSLAVDATHLYFNVLYGQTAGFIMRVPLGTTTVEQVTTTPQPQAFAVGRTNVFVSDGSGAIYAAPLAVAASATKIVATSGPPGPIRLDGPRVYFVDQDGVKALSGSAATLLSSVTPFTMLLRGDDLVLADFSNGILSSVPTAGGSTTTLATGQPGVLYPMSCGAALCWADAGTATTTAQLMQLAPGGPPKQLSASPALYHPTGFVFDGQSFYGNVAAGPGAIVRVPAAGGDPVPLATMGGHGDVVADEQCIYWSSLDAIYCLAKDSPGPFPFSLQ